MGLSTQRVAAIYHVRSDAASIAARAEAIAIEQSVELPPHLISDTDVLTNIVGRVERTDAIGEGLFEVEISLSGETLTADAGQIMNVAFGNTSLHDDVTLIDLALPAEALKGLGGPNLGIDGIRKLVGSPAGAITASVLKPQGLPPKALAQLAGELAAGGISIIKDDHGLAEQPFSPFAKRVKVCAQAVRAVSEKTGHTTIYAPSLSGDLDNLRRQLELMRAEGLKAALVAPMVIGLPAFQALAREASGIALLAHPSMAGAARVAPPLLLGHLFRALGADATIFPNYGGRFSYSADRCRDIATKARAPVAGLKPSAPMPAGGMTLDRIGEMLDFYGEDCILLIGGGVFASGGVERGARAFVESVARHGR
jgi:ribulose-bisphosphate carboxylase large chain